MGRFVCDEHGEIEQVLHRGNTLDTGPGGPTQRDLEGIDFVFNVIENNGPGELTLELESADDNEGYLSKFADWGEIVTNAAENEYEHDCPECRQVVRWEHE